MLTDRGAGGGSDRPGTAEAGQLLCLRLPPLLPDQPVEAPARAAVRLRTADVLAPVLAPELLPTVLDAVLELLDHAGWCRAVRALRCPERPPPRLCAMVRGDALRIELGAPGVPNRPEVVPSWRPEAVPSGRPEPAACTGAGRMPCLHALTRGAAATAGRTASGYWLEVRESVLPGTVRVHGTTDTALAALTAPALPPRDIRLRLAATAQTAADVRHLLDAACRRWDLGHLVDPAMLVVTELVTNAVRHAGTDLDIAIAYRREQLCLSVRDRAAAPPVPTDPARHDQVPPARLPHDGRGLHIVEAYTSAWGYNPGRVGKTVWATMPA